MSLRQITLSAKFGFELARKFNIETWAISELFWSKLRKYKTGKILKCNIIASDVLENSEYVHSSHINVANSHQLFDFNFYFNLNSKYEKKLMQLDILRKGMIEIASAENWEIEPIENAYFACLEQKLENKFLVNDKLKSSPNRKIKAGIWCCWDIDIFKLYLILFDENGQEIHKEKFVDNEPHLGEFIYYLKLKWIDQSNIQITENKKKWGFNIEKALK